MDRRLAMLGRVTASAALALTLTSAGLPVLTGGDRAPNSVQISLDLGWGQPAQAAKGDKGNGNQGNGQGNGNGNGGGNGNGNSRDNGNGGNNGNGGSGGNGGNGGNGGGANRTPAFGLNDHPSGKDRTTSPGGSGDQGRSMSDPDGNANGGVDKPGFTRSEPWNQDTDQDFNNGCGNDDDFEDDNRGNCGGPRVGQDTEDGSVGGIVIPGSGGEENPGGGSPATGGGGNDNPGSVGGITIPGGGGSDSPGGVGGITIPGSGPGNAGSGDGGTGGLHISTVPGGISGGSVNGSGSFLAVGTGSEFAVRRMPAVTDGEHLAMQAISEFALAAAPMSGLDASAGAVIQGPVMMSDAGGPEAVSVNSLPATGAGPSGAVSGSLLMLLTSGVAAFAAWRARRSTVS